MAPIPRRTFVAVVAGSVAVRWPRLLAADSRVARLTDDTLPYASATVLAEAIRQKRVSSVEVVDTCLRRIEQVNPRLNAVVQLTADAARAGACQADADLARGVLSGPLHGVPFTVKDSFDTAGVISTAGTQGWARRIPAEDATIVAGRPRQYSCSGNRIHAWSLSPWPNASNLCLGDSP